MSEDYEPKAKAGWLVVRLEQVQSFKKARRKKQAGIRSAPHQPWPTKTFSQGEFGRQSQATIGPNEIDQISSRDAWTKMWADLALAGAARATKMRECRFHVWTML
jgi:hypothetical protein